MRLKFNSTILPMFELIVGILLLVNPVGFATGIIMFLGAMLLIAGTFSIAQYFRASPEEAAMGKSLMLGLIEILIGVFCTFNSGWFIVTFPLLTVIFGVATLITGTAKVQWAVDMLRMKKKKWFLTGIGAAVTIICSVIIIGNPFATTAVLWAFISITLIVEAAMDVLAAVFSRENVK